MNNKMEKHLTVLGILFLIFSTILLIMGLMISIGVPMIVNILSTNEFSNNTFDNITKYVGIVLLTFSIPGYIGAYGLFNKKSWGRIFAIVICILSLFSIPFGTCMGVYGLYILMQDDIIELFENKKK